MNVAGAVARDQQTAHGEAPLIQHVITDLDTGGAEMMLCRLIGRAEPARGRHTVVCLRRGGSLRDCLTANKTPVSDLGLDAGQIRPARLLRLWRLVRTQQPQLLQGWLYHGNLAATLGSLRWGRPCPTVWGIHLSISDLASEKRQTRWLIRALAQLSHRPTAIVYCSTAIARQHEEIGYRADRTVVIPNGFDGQLFRPQPEARAKLCAQLGIDPGAIVIGMVARVHPTKDHGNLIEAVGRLKARGHDLHLVLIGRGVDSSASIEHAVAAAALSDRVHCLAERHDVAALVAGFDIAALASRGEAFPNVLGEAMASGVPCVATDVGDCAWIIGDTGVVVPPRDALALCEGLARLVELGPQGRHRRGASARARILEHFELGAIVRRYEDLYARLVEPSP